MAWGKEKSLILIHITGNFPCHVSCNFNSIFSIKFKHSNKFFPKFIFATKFPCGIEFGNLLFGGVYKCL